MGINCEVHKVHHAFFKIKSFFYKYWTCILRMHFFRVSQIKTWSWFAAQAGVNCSVTIFIICTPAALFPIRGEVAESAPGVAFQTIAATCIGHVAWFVFFFAVRSHSYTSGAIVENYMCQRTLEGELRAASLPGATPCLNLDSSSRPFDDSFSTAGTAASHACGCAASVVRWENPTPPRQLSRRPAHPTQRSRSSFCASVTPSLLAKRCLLLPR